VNNWAYSDLNRGVTAALDEGAIGDVTNVEVRIGRPDCALGNTGWNPRWRTEVAHSGGGIILDHGWHQFYLLMGWMREPLQAVRATARTVDQRHFPVEDEALIDMHFPRGRGRIELSWTAPGRTNEGVIRGTRGTIRTYDDRVVVENDRGRQDLPFDCRVSQSSYHPEWFQSVFACNILDEDRREADRNFAEAGVLVSAIRAAYRSARQDGALCRPELVAHDPGPTGGAEQSNGDSSGVHPA
jgi:predicted dehydrogenase